MAPQRTPPPGGRSEEGQGEISPQERQAFKQRADELGRRLEQAKGQDGLAAKTHGASGAESAANASALSAALKVSTELIGGIVVGSGLGWAADKAFGSWPAGFIAGFLLGTVAGLLNVVRAASRIKTGPGNPSAGPTVRDDDED